MKTQYIHLSWKMTAEPVRNQELAIKVKDDMQKLVPFFAKYDILGCLVHFDRAVEIHVSFLYRGSESAWWIVELLEFAKQQKLEGVRAELLDQPYHESESEFRVFYCVDEFEGIWGLLKEEDWITYLDFGTELAASRKKDQE